MVLLQLWILLLLLLVEGLEFTCLPPLLPVAQQRKGW